MFRKRLLLALAFALVIAANFLFGFMACLRLKSAAGSDAHQKVFLQKGDAPSSVRNEVLASLRAFQEGYLRRDPQQLNAFMRRLFPETDDVLVLGTDAGEWARGYRDVGQFVVSDWKGWGNFKFAVEDSLVWYSGDVAWTASVGTVEGQRLKRPVRFSAILKRYGHRWLFRQAHFQWDERDPDPSDLSRPSTHLKLVKLFLEYIPRVLVKVRDLTGLNS